MVQHVHRRVLSWSLGAVGLAVYLLIRCGFGPYPSLETLLVITRAYPSILELEPRAQYLHHSPAGLILARLVGADSTASFVALHITVFVVAFIAMTVVVAKRCGATIAWTVAVAFVTSQVAVVMTAWVGSYDTFTWLFGTAIVLARRRSVAVVCGALAALAAFEQTLISLVLLLAVTAMAPSRRSGTYVAALVGLVAGRIAAIVVLRNGGADHDRLYYLREAGASRFVDQFLDVWPLLLLTAFGGAWALVICFVRALDGRERTMWIAALVLAVVPCAFGEDQTRVYALITWPLLLAMTLRAAPQVAPRRLRGVTWLALGLGLVLPPIYLWVGRGQFADHHVWHLVG
jgi:hypothetical protein